MLMPAIRIRSQVCPISRCHFSTPGLGFSLANGTPLDTLDLNRIYILTTERTCSASESLINSLRGIDVEVILFGDTTCGKPYGFFPTDNCGQTYFTIQFRGVNDKNFGDYADGFTPNDSANAFAIKTPGCTVVDDFDTELGDPAERLLATALYYRENGACPNPPLPKPTVASSSQDARKQVQTDLSQLITRGHGR